MKRGTPEHPKVLDLCDRLKCDRPTAVGYLEMLWHFAAKYAPQGDIGRYSDRRIEGAMDWSGRGKQPGKLIEALVAARWIDRDAHHRLVIHDWSDHADDSVRKRLARAGLCFLDVRPKVTGQSGYADRKLSRTQTHFGCLPVPEPEPDSSLSQGDKPQPVGAPLPSVTQNVAERFAEWIEPWPRVADVDSARRLWVLRVSQETVVAAFACRDRYLTSDEVANRGVIQEPWKFIRTQADNDWAGKWPAARDRNGDSSSAKKQAAIDAQWAEVTDGSRQH
jgi:hypothetical protein